MIYLTGAGCGELALLTLKAKYVLEKADCVLYDRLLNEEILSLCKPSCETIYVGKANHNHSMPQDQIDQLLVEKGNQYACVVRLKGGDPYVFGRGGEEALYLAAHNLPFCVIPGITSSIAAGTYAGIPVTHRLMARGFRVMSAHQATDAINEFDYPALAHTSDTLIFLMGLSHIKEIVTQLLKAGKAKDTPIALISHGGSCEQEVITSTLIQILDVTYENIVSPGIIMVGETITLRADLSFYERLPLFHKCYLMATLCEERNLYWQFEEQGASLKTCICGHVEHRPEVLKDVTIESYTHILFTSKHAIDAFFEGLYAKQLDARCLASHTLCAIGKKSAQHLLAYGCRCDMVSPIADSEHFASYLSEKLNKGDRLLIVKAENANHKLQELLSIHAAVDVVCLYQTIEHEYTPIKRHYDGILFTCCFAVHSMMKKIATWDAIYDVVVYAIGMHTKSCLESYGFQHIVMLPHADKQAFITEIMKEEHHVSR